MAAKKGTRKQLPAGVKLPNPTETVAPQWHPGIPGGTSPVAVKPTMNSLPWDKETKTSVGQKILSIRDLQGFANAPLSNRMEQVWGMFTGIQTATDKPNSTIYIGRSDPKEDPTAVQVNRGGSQNLANFSLLVPLTKLGVRPKPNRQWDILVEEMEMADGPPVFVVKIVARNSNPRNLAEEQAEAAAGKAGAAKSGGSAAKGGKKKAGSAKDEELLDEDEEFLDEDEDLEI